MAGDDGSRRRSNSSSGLHGGSDYVRIETTLVERFQLDTAKKVRALSKGNRQKVQLIAALATSRRFAVAR